MSLPPHALQFLRAIPDAAILTTSRGVVLAANRKARRALALTTERPADCNLYAQIADPAPRLADTLRAWARSTEPLPGAFTLASPDGALTCNAMGSVVVPGDETTPALLIVRFWPRTEANPFILLNQKVAELHDEVARRVQVEDALRRSETALQERVKEAEALNRAKDEFLATVSHELRTPLNAILGWSTLLRRRALDEQTVKAIEVIHRNAKAQAKLVDDILDVSRIITGKMRIEVRPADLCTIVEDAVEVVRPSGAAKQIRLAFRRPEGGCFFVADPDRIRQAVWNVLSNAVKFTERGGAVDVEVRQRGSQFDVVVSDTGTGIEASFLPHVFDRFKQADSSTTRRTGGLGLGLALVRSIVELHGGTVTAASEGLGRGATFVLTLPVRATLPEAAPELPPAALVVSSEARQPLALHGFRALVVDDEPDARDLLHTVLTQAGAEVETAASASAALALLEQFRPHVLVSDIGMPDENGYSLMRRLRERAPDQGGDIPAVALTAYTRAEDRREALAAGFTTHIGKPVRPDDLVSVVAGLAASRARP